jgi:F0F1-type ATP synthase membrane subunit b/b'
MHSDLQEREAMRRKLLVLFVAFASVFGVMACGGAVEVEEESEEAKQEEREAQEEEREAEKEREEAQEELKEAKKAMDEEQ